ncbi:hypothetical protein JK167_11680 [Levilactobacillus brevis]|uniref:Uncharacterized protein n=1 Tax=Levilactobacillus brevis TaxID=1580 RepID=A0AA41JTV7_LEVBR|nr:hypothetical protein [Levilactobacillus brevis]MBS0948337.1 hypothetical protein [Levilactobacillus brevis]MBS1011482.1 hypothetical protein [Levilactobacillus brevis]
MDKECPIDQIKLTMFNEYELKDGTICYDCAKKLGLVGTHDEDIVELAKAAKAIINVDKAKQMIASETSVDVNLLKSVYADTSTDNKNTDDMDTNESSQSEGSHDNPSTQDIDLSKKEPKIWKGDGVTGFLYGIAFGFVVGLFNMMFFHISHLGVIVWIATWLIMGLHPHFKDNRTNEEIAADAEKTRKDREAALASKKDAKQPSPTSNVSQTVVVGAPKKKTSRKAPHCPKCKSNNIQILDNKRKFSVGKTAVGGVVFGAAGAAVGAFSGKKGKKYHAVCMDCGKKFQIKL